MSRSQGVRRGVAPVFASPVAGPPKPPRNAPNVDIIDANETPIQGTHPLDGHDEDVRAFTPPPAVLYTERFASSVPRGTSDVTLAQTTVEDIDQLWDWVRADREGTTAFLGLAHPNTASFFSQIGQIGQKEKDGVAWLRSIKRGDSLIGFVILDPIQRGNPPVGKCHIYVSPDERGSLPELLPSLIAEGDRLLPGVTLFVATSEEGWATMLKAVGFASQIVLTRQSPLTGSAHGPQAV